MILECKFCGAPLTDRHRIPGPTLQLKCAKCKNVTVVEPEKASALGFKPPSAEGAAEPAPFRPGALTQAPPDSATPPAGLNVRGAAGSPSSTPVAAITVSATEPPTVSAPAATLGSGNGGATAPLVISPEAFADGAASGTAAAAAKPNGDSPPSETAATTDKQHYLQKIKLFSQLSVEECLAIERRLKRREFPPMQAMVKEGGPGDAMFFINAGAVEVRKKDPNTGIDFLLSELKAGSCFGEMALLTGKPRAASVVAVEPTTCWVLEMAAFDEVLLTSPKSAWP